MKSPFTGGEVVIHRQKSELLFRKEMFEYVKLSYKCVDTQELYTNTKIDEINISQVYNQYRVKYGIPFPDEIVAIRKRYELSASKMSEILGFGNNQYRLYERGDMPSEANGKVLHSIIKKKIFEVFVNNAENQFTSNEFATIRGKLEKSTPETNINLFEKLIFDSYSRSNINGYASQSYTKLKNIILYFIAKSGGVFNTKMNKLLFYTDFLSYKEYGCSMSGLAYKAIQYGPVPVRWDTIYGLIDGVHSEIIEFSSGYSGTKLCSKIEPDMEKFSAEECLVLDAVYNKFKDVNANKISEISHREDAWKNFIGTSDMIDFSEAFTIKAL